MEVFDSFCIGVVLYYPTKEEVEKLKEYSKIVQSIYVYDNTESNKPDFINNVQTFDNCIYISNNRNDGISKSLNYLCEKAIEDGFKYILLLDQDSIFDITNIKKLFTSIKKCALENVGVFAPLSKPIKSYKESSYSYKENMNNEVIREVDWKITSGSVIDLDVFNTIGGFDENLFIDKVDYDYCKTLKKNGYKTVEVSNSFLYQFLGEAQGGIFNFSQHNPIRHYYLFRNRLYIVKKYKEDYKGTRKLIFLLLSITRHILSVLIFESEKLRKIKAMSQAYKDYKNKKMGKLEVK